MDVCWEEAFAPCNMGPVEKVAHSVDIMIGKMGLTCFFC